MVSVQSRHYKFRTLNVIPTVTIKKICVKIYTKENEKVIKTVHHKISTNMKKALMPEMRYTKVIRYTETNSKITELSLSVSVII